MSKVEAKKRRGGRRERGRNRGREDQGESKELGARKGGSEIGQRGRGTKGKSREERSRRGSKRKRSESAAKVDEEGKEGTCPAWKVHISLLGGGPRGVKGRQKREKALRWLAERGTMTNANGADGQGARDREWMRWVWAALVCGKEVGARGRRRGAEPLEQTLTRRLRLSVRPTALAERPDPPLSIGLA